MTWDCLHGYLESTKEIVLKIGDETYNRAINAAKARKISLSDLVEEFFESIVESPQSNRNGIADLFAALDNGRNTAPVGPLRREELHDRAILHRH